MRTTTLTLNDSGLLQLNLEETDEGLVLTVQNVDADGPEAQACILVPAGIRKEFQTLVAAW